MTQSRAEEIEQLARKIAGNNTSPIILECARTMAEAELEIAHLRRIRAALIEQAARPRKVGSLPLNSIAEIRLLQRWRTIPNVRMADASSVPGLPPAESDRTAESVRRLLPKLQILALYEQRVRSRREKSLESIVQALKLEPGRGCQREGPRRDPSSTANQP
jgi:hypothetical protein